MKKTLLVLAALLLLLCLAACGEAETLRAAAPTPAPVSDPTPRPKASPPPEGLVTHDEAEAAPETFVLNRKTKKYHAPDCPSVDDMSEKNKQIFEGTREQVEAQGFAACKRCGGGA